MNLSHVSLNWHLTGGKSQTLGCTGLSLGFCDFQKQLRKTATWSSQTGQYAGLRGKCHWRLLRVVKWTQHTSDLQEGNAAVWCIPASRRASSAAARRGAKPQTPRRKLLGVWQRTIAADITPPRGEIKDSKVTQSLGKDYIDLPSILMCRLLLRHPGEVSTNAAEIVAAQSSLLSWAERSGAELSGQWRQHRLHQPWTALFRTARLPEGWSHITDMGQGVSVEIIWWELPLSIRIYRMYEFKMSS